LETRILPKRHPCLGRREVQARQTVQLVGVLVLKTEDSKWQVHPLGEVGLSHFSRADGLLARVASYGSSVGLDSSAWRLGIWYRRMGVLLVLLKQHRAVRPLPHPRCHSVNVSTQLQPITSVLQDKQQVKLQAKHVA